MKRARVICLSVLALLLALPATADTFEINVCNISDCSLTTTPAGTITVTQSGNTLTFAVSMIYYPASSLQWAIGSQGGGDTFAMQLKSIPSDLTFGMITATYYGGTSGLGDAWALHTTSNPGDPNWNHEDGFGYWNVTLNDPSATGGKPVKSFTYLKFTLTGTGLDLSDITFNSPDANCDGVVPVPVKCYFAMHLNAINDAPPPGGGTTNWNTGYGGATLTSTPEPASLLLLAAGTLGLLGVRRLRK